jgi:hypothetical protein
MAGSMLRGLAIQSTASRYGSSGIVRDSVVILIYPLDLAYEKLFLRVRLTPGQERVFIEHIMNITADDGLSCRGRCREFFVG